MLEGRLLGTVCKSSPVTRIFLFGSLPNSSHLQLDGQPRRYILSLIRQVNVQICAEIFSHIINCSNRDSMRYVSVDITAL